MVKLSRIWLVFYVLKLVMDSKLDRFINLGIFELLEYNEWEIFIVIVLKKGNIV